MNDTPHHLVANEDHLQEVLPECPKMGKPVVSPLGWSITGRLICAAAASGLLWLSVVWALGWPK